MKSITKVITTENAPKAIGPYSQGIVANGFVYSSGQLAICHKQNKFIGGDIESQAKLVLYNLKSVVEAGGSCMERIVKVTIFLKDFNHFPKVNEIYATYFTKNLPARSTVEVARLPLDALIEIEAVAVI